ncbi:MAG: hypothetical protein ACRC2K_05230, partial [Clostridium sp.]
ILFLRLLFYKDKQNKRTMDIAVVGNKDNKINLTLESKLNKRTMEEEKKLNDYIVKFLEVISEGKTITFINKERSGERVEKIISTKEELKYFFEILKENKLFHEERFKKMMNKEYFS